MPRPEAVAEFLKIMDEEANLPVLIHCEHGVGRTGVFAAIYRMEYQGWPNARAQWEALALAGFESFREDRPKGRFILDYVPRGTNGRER